MMSLMGTAHSAHAAVFFSFLSLLSCSLHACALSFGVLPGRTKPMLLSRFVSCVLYHILQLTRIYGLN